jgi:superfamily II DNA or RNA helicase
MKKKISPKNRTIYENINNEIELLKKNDLINSYLGNKGYSIYKVCLNKSIIDFIKSELTVKPFTNNSLVQPNSFPLYQESDKKIYVPRFWGIQIFGNPKVIKINYGKSINLNFKGCLRKEPVDQEEIVKSYLNHINFDTNLEHNASGSALIDLKCGGGKTVIGLYICSVIKKKTIIFVHKTFLKNQWIERITQYLPNAKIGSIQGQVIDIEDKDIVIAMIQSISMKSYPESLFDEFGLSIYDECHHISSEIFSNCLRKCTTLYGLGLSATMERKDGLTHVFKMYLGDVCYKNKAIQTRDNVLVKAIDYKVLDDDEYNEVLYDYRGNVKHTTMISKVASYEYRSNFILSIIYNEFKVNPNQQIILLSQTKNMLNYLYKLITNSNILSSGYYIGGMKEADLKLSEKKQVILATYAMAAEALDIPTLTTLVLATSKSDIVQAVGRILRMKHNNPLIIDIIDQHECFISQFNKRKAFYNEKNYKIIRTNNENYIKYINNVNNNILTIDEELWKTLVYKPRNKNKNNTLNIDISDTNEHVCLI